MLKGIYLGAFRALHIGHNIVYQDINGKRDLDGDMMNIDLSDYDFIIATPPCNYWSRANYRREVSDYAQKTKHLLPDILKKLSLQDKPFIVENVRNDNFFTKYGLFDLGLNVYKVGRHTYWSNVSIDYSDIIQKPIVEVVDGVTKYMSSQNLSRTQRQGGNEVYVVIERFIKCVENKGGSIMKCNLCVAKRVSKSGNTYLSASIKVGDFGKRDYFFININNVQALTGLSIQQITDADNGVLFDKDIEV